MMTSLSNQGAGDCQPANRWCHNHWPPATTPRTAQLASHKWGAFDTLPGAAFAPFEEVRRRHSRHTPLIDPNKVHSAHSRGAPA